MPQGPQICGKSRSASSTRLSQKSRGLEFIIPDDKEKLNYDKVSPSRSNYFPETLMTSLRPGDSEPMYDEVTPS